jgi:hypothetical protein
MGQKAVIRFLNHWRKHQEDDKNWPLKFLKPDPLRIQGDPKLPNLQKDNDSRDGQEVEPDGEEKGGGSMDGEEVGPDSEDEGEEDKDQGSGRGPVDKGKGVAMINSGREMPKDIISGTPDQADTTPFRKLFLSALSKQASYHKLIGFLDTADVRNLIGLQ